MYILGQLADALHYVHSFEVALDDSPDTDDFEMLELLHRDLCPANVLLSIEGDVLLSDFGSASSKWLAHDLTSGESGHIAMSPDMG